MDKYFKENSKLSDEEIEQEFPEHIATALKVQKSQETKVMRLTNKEATLIRFLRERRLEVIVRELRYAITKSTLPSDVRHIKEIMSILDTRKIFQLSELIEMDIITKQQAEYLIKSMNENKNIIITGAIGVGKTTLLNALLNNLKNTNTTIVQRIDELNLNIELYKDNHIISYLGDKININSIILLNDEPNNNLVFGEIRNGDAEDGLSILSALNVGMNIIGTSHSKRNKGNWKEEFLSKTNKKMKKYAEETLADHNFIQVHITKDNEQRKVTIEEI